MTNRLSNETSPYLLQHAHNPVDWFPWNNEALAKAQEEDKPIFLSIGYASCHWCHVMAHESFEDPETAAFLNQNYINIKVDREERPDLDSIYMSAVVGMTGQGGWPLSVFLTPDGRPFYGGTYFPPVPKYGMPSFKDVLYELKKIWQDNRNDALESADQITRHIQENAQWNIQHKDALTSDTLDHAVNELTKTYDWKNGGWGMAPKFPHPLNILFLLLQATRSNEDALKTSIHALKTMNRGGIYDAIGGGFHRYSTDNEWLIPHFEKMLYDNALLSIDYLYAYLISGEPGFRYTCEGILDFVTAEMTDGDGGFYSSLDADSGGNEGTYYIWEYDEIANALDPIEKDFFLSIYSISQNGNFEGKNVLQRRQDDQELVIESGLSHEEFYSLLDQCHQRLMQVRSLRQRPATDDKVITSWNALMLWAFSEAARLLNRIDYLKIAQRNAHFLLDNLYSNGRLFRTWRNGQSKYDAYLEDYSALIIGLISLYQADNDIRWFESAVKLAEEMISAYKDTSGGFYNTRSDDKSLLVRPKDLQDNAIPSANAMAAHALLLLSAYQDKSAWRSQADDLLENLQFAAKRYPTAFGFWLYAMDFAVGPVKQMAVVWPDPSQASSEIIHFIKNNYQPRSIIAAAQLPLQENAPALLHNRPAVDNLPTAYICEGFICNQPVNKITGLKGILPQFTNHFH